MYRHLGGKYKIPIHHIVPSSHICSQQKVETKQLAAIVLTQVAEESCKVGSKVALSCSRWNFRTANTPAQLSVVFSIHGECAVSAETVPVNF